MPMTIENMLYWGQLPAFLLFVLLLLFLSRAGAEVAAHGFACAATNLRRPEYRNWVLAMLAILPVNVALTGFDSQLAQRLRLEDLAHRFAAIEGPLLAACQAWTPPALNALAVMIYVAGFPALIVAAVLVALAQRRRRLLELVALGFLANYVLVQLFYFFFPVSEAHSILPGVRELMAQISPRLAASYRPMSGLDNCFPSLHTSLTLTMVLSLRLLGNRRLNLVFGLFAATIVASTLYLGIHWVSDLLAGGAFAWLCHRVALRVVADEGLSSADLAPSWSKRRA